MYYYCTRVYIHVCVTACIADYIGLTSSELLISWKRDNKLTSIVAIGREGERERERDRQDGGREREREQEGMEKMKGEEGREGGREQGRKEADTITTLLPGLYILWHRRKK